MAIDESTQDALAKCSRLKARDYRNRTRHAIDELDRLISALEVRRVGVRPSPPALVGIIQNIVASIDRATLWNPKGNIHERQLAASACRLFQCLCQLDVECATSDEALSIMRSFLQWLKDDIDFCLTKSVR